MEHPSNSSVIAAYEAEKRTAKKVTLENCIIEYSREETLGEEDTWYCPNCKDHRRIKKKIDIWSVPNVMIFGQY
jgi:ubiquitin carboxyl-terminal hydrolase 4/11/15